MRGAWKPWAAYGGLAAGLGAAMVVFRGAPWWTAPVVALASSPLVLVIVLRAWLPVSAFVRGLREGGVAVEVVRDDVGWFGDRALVAREPRGEWRVECWAGNAIHLIARGPAMRARRDVKGSARKAGREAATEGALR